MQSRSYGVTFRPTAESFLHYAGTGVLGQTILLFDPLTWTLPHDRADLAACWQDCLFGSLQLQLLLVGAGNMLLSSSVSGELAYPLSVAGDSDFRRCRH